MDKQEDIRVLIVDDEESIVSFLKMGLEEQGYKVDTANDGETAIKLAEIIKPQVIILDVMLPIVNGYDVCKEIKKNMDTIIIMLTARYEIEDKVIGLSIGADDYMVKPYSFIELLARIKARLRSNKNSVINAKNNSSLFKMGNFILNDDAHEIKYNNLNLSLSLTEYKLLKFLLINNNIVLSKTKILDEVWGYDFYGDQNVVEVYIKYLRNKIGDKEHTLIQTVRGVGYKVVNYEN